MSEASETLTWVTQLKIGDVCLLVHMFGRTYVICTLTLTYYCVRSMFDPVPTESSGYRSIPIILEIELFTTMKFFAGAVRTQKITGVPYLFELVVVVS